MNTARNIITTAIIMILATGAMADTDAVMRLKSVSPSESEDWNSAGGVEMQLRLWDSGSISIAAGIGYETWNAVEEYVVETDGGDEFRSTVSGSAAVIPVGISMLYRQAIDEPGGREPGAYFLLEAGIRYAMVDSDVYSEVTSMTADGTSVFADTIEIDDAWLASITGALEIRLAHEMALEIGIGYQMDLSAPGETWLNEAIGTTSFQGGSAYVGLSFGF